jgi:hypothetical protein
VSLTERLVEMLPGLASRFGPDVAQETAVRVLAYKGTLHNGERAYHSFIIRTAINIRNDWYRRFQARPQEQSMSPDELARAAVTAPTQERRLMARTLLEKMDQLGKSIVADAISGNRLTATQKSRRFRAVRKARENGYL